MPLKKLETLVHFLGLRPDRRAKQIIAVLFDCSAAMLALWVAASLPANHVVWPDLRNIGLYALSPLIFLPIFVRYGLYRAVFRYSGAATIKTLLVALGLHLLLFVPLMLLSWSYVGLTHPRTAAFIYAILFPALVVLSRFTVRFALTSSNRRAPVKLMIYGAGQAGIQTADALERSLVYRVVGFLDDDPRKVGQVINNRRVYDMADLDSLVNLQALDEILIAMPSLARRKQLSLLAELKQWPIKARILPSMDDLTSGLVTFSNTRKVNSIDLLSRAPIVPEHGLMKAAVEGRTLLVTGAAGTIGSEICRQALEFRPSRLVLVDHSEFGLYQIAAELTELAGSRQIDLVIKPVLGSVRHYKRMRSIIAEARPHTIFHAAAYKHVPLVEQHPSEGLDANAFGTLNVARAAIELQVPSFVLVSTDKAVYPHSIMGASKRLAEMVVQALADDPAPQFDGNIEIIRKSTHLSIVRFGNVLDSSGSVIPLFRQQIASGKAVTITHPDVTRYFMTIAEASQLVIQSSVMTSGGDIFVLKMGDPVRIQDLARRMIELSGNTIRDEKNPGGDVAIEYIGLRRGEKLHEELFHGPDVSGTEHSHILSTREPFPRWADLSIDMQTLAVHLGRDDVDAIRAELTRLVGYRSLPDRSLAGERAGPPERPDSPRTPPFQAILRQRETGAD
ncbi:FlaA1/EpsC-like NDP-sugar epimerase [Hoeflea marina]|uniref:FlaA1/EpsC-like NDP-sugar epimerase n=1 Tax=Hoeflea marina TaxID=274592 RepID=A0A317PMB5_9HYPH|nr:nucleoside-diphosphate sugar epimerase/dehydratase [Hoeflea marina]PWW01906.1 FlaA1/EpsC-like NDP-sugar epimerase [Hoeflea marina]